MGYQSSTTTPVQRSYPGPAAQVYVYLTGTGSPGTLATIYQDNLGTALANPFSASTLGYWFFYAANGRYDVSCVGAGIPSGRITYGDNVLFDQTTSFAAGSGISVSTISGLTTITNTGLLSLNSITGAVSIAGTANQVIVDPPEALSRSPCRSRSLLRAGRRSVRLP